MLRNENLVLLDETGNYCYSPKNMKVFRVVKGSIGNGWFINMGKYVEKDLARHDFT